MIASSIASDVQRAEWTKRATHRPWQSLGEYCRIVPSSGLGTDWVTLVLCASDACRAASDSKNKASLPIYHGIRRRFMANEPLKAFFGWWQHSISHKNNNIMNTFTSFDSKVPQQRHLLVNVPLAKVKNIKIVKYVELMFGDSFYFWTYFCTDII